MRLDDQTLKRHLHREAARAPIPDDMWQKISGQLEQEAQVAEKRRHMVARMEQWKPALAFAAAAGIFWLAIIPSESATRQTHAVITPGLKVVESAAVQPVQNDVLPEVSTFVRTEKPTPEEPAKKFGFIRYSVNVQ